MRYAVAIALLVGLATVGQAQETHTITLYKPKVGDSVRIAKTEKANLLIEIKDKDGNPLKQIKQISNEEQNYVETILELPDPDKKPTKLKRAYGKLVTDKEDGKKEPPYANKTVLIEKKDGKYTFRIEGGDAITGMDAASLDKEFNKKGEGKSLDRLLMPTKPLKIGDTWTPNGDEITKELNREGGLHASKVSAKGKLTKVYEKDGRKFGVMDITVDVLADAMGEGKALKLDPPAKLSFKGIMDVCIDGTSETGSLKLDIRMDANSKIDLGGMDGIIAISGGGPAVETRTQLKGK